MDSKLFRKESLERFSSPEALHDYLRVTSPRMWMVLTAVLLLTAGFVFYASSATMEETLPVQVRVMVSGEGENARTQVSAELPPEMKGVVQPGMPVRFEGMKGSVETVYETESVIGILVRMGKDFAGLPDGTYEGLIVTDSTTPVGFLLGEE